MVFSSNASDTGFSEDDIPRLPVAVTFTVARWFPERFLNMMFTFATSAFTIRFSVFTLAAEASFDWVNETWCMGRKTTVAATRANTRIEMSMMAATEELFRIAGCLTYTGAVVVGVTGVPQL